MYGEDAIDVTNTKYINKFEFLEQNFTSLITNYNGAEIYGKVDRDSVHKHKHQAKKYRKKLREENPAITKEQLARQSLDPVLSALHPLKNFGAISESIDEKLK